MDNVPKPRRGKLPVYLNPHEVQGLLSVVEGAPKLLFLLEWRAGLRVSEALGLLTSNVDLNPKDPVLTVVDGKGGKDRTVPIHHELRDALVAVTSYSGKGRPRSKPVPVIAQGSRTWAHRQFKEALQTAISRGLMQPKTSCSNHSLRHSAARHWLANGVPINMVSNWLGHGNLSATLVYLRILPDSNGLMQAVP